MTDTAQPVSLTLTPSAEKFILRMLRMSGLGPSGGFRLEVSPGGCSGLSSQFSVEAAPKSGDQVVQLSQVTLFLPAPSAKLLDGGNHRFPRYAHGVGAQVHRSEGDRLCVLERGPSGYAEQVELTSAQAAPERARPESRSWNQR